MWLSKLALLLASAAVSLAAEARNFAADPAPSDASPGVTTFLRVSSDVVAGAADNGPRFRVLQAAPAPGANPNVGPGGVVLAPAAQNFPPVWIGVRCTPLPESLAAHIGNKGLMVANILVNSPADRAGLVQYDVILRLNGRAIESAEGLIDAVGQLGADKTGELEIIRGGKEMKLSIQPAARSAAGDAQFKYHEPDVVTMREMKLRGRALRPDGQGNWMLQDLGDFQRLPDLFRDLEPLWDQWGTFFTPGDPDDPSGSPDVDTDADADAQVEVRVSINRNGQSIDVQRSKDGTFTVTRSEPGGQPTTKTYESADEFRQDDEATYRAYLRHGGGRGRVMIFSPSADDLMIGQQDLRARVEEMARKAREHAGRLKDQARDMAREMRNEAQLLWRGQWNNAGSGESTVVKMDASGAIKILTTTAGKSESAEFANVEELKKNRPDLYEKVKNIFE